MKIGILGTGIVGETIATKLAALGHEVLMGSRTKDNTKAQDWAAKMGGKAAVGTFAEAARHAEIVINATQGAASLAALTLAGAENLGTKILIDVANPLDFSKGMPPSLTVSNTDSLGEQIQRAFPGVRVVKALNTMSVDIMINPGSVAGDHDVFVSGNDAEAKEAVAALLVEGFGWKKENVIDLGDITTARGTEALLLLWIRLWGALGNPHFNFRVVRA